jgi:hypothetical protein
MPVFGPLLTPRGFGPTRKLLFACSHYTDQVSNTAGVPTARKQVLSAVDNNSGSPMFNHQAW